VLALLACSGPTPVPPFAGPGPARAVVVGDSISFLAAPKITVALGGAGYSTSVSGQIGYTTKQAGTMVRAYRRFHPSVVILEWGTNDATHLALGQPGYSLADYQRRMSAFRDDYKGSCVIVTTVSEHRGPSSGPDYAGANQAAATMNAWLRTFPRVVDWDAREFAARSAGQSWVGPDLIHPNDTGQAQLAQLDLAAARTCPPATP
jgi:hypothetical protein